MKTLEELESEVGVDPVITYKIARKHQRFFAFVFDFLLVLVFTLMLINVIIIPKIYPGAPTETNKLIQENSNNPNFIFSDLLTQVSPELKKVIQVSQITIILSFWFYFAFSEIYMLGGSLGKKIFSLKVINRRTLAPPRPLESFLRSGLKTMALLAFFPILIINFLISFFNTENKSGHDILSRTLVIEDSPIPIKKKRNRR